ncbi:hypothetical protein HPB50_005990 [Hyalomma asiaticum]|uniref:Uncharacterized protein n=1 Tax=Hyalomma asiaticum TaxID=266040 RepID=A0ACB7S7V4_HYAAI|nr:hypothetical protein HPB50_005990 [Hyalomma asiaticum]
MFCKAPHEVTHVRFAVKVRACASLSAISGARRLARFGNFLVQPTNRGLAPLTLPNQRSEGTFFQNALGRAYSLEKLPTQVPPLTPGTNQKMTQALTASFSSWEKEREALNILKALSRDPYISTKVRAISVADKDWSGRVGTGGGCPSTHCGVDARGLAGARPQGEVRPLLPRSKPKQACCVGQDIPCVTDPRQWTEMDVANWLSWAIREFSLEGVNMPNFAMKGKDMCALGKDAFLTRFPPFMGDILWEHLDILQKVLREVMGSRRLSIRCVIDATQLNKELVKNDIVDCPQRWQASTEGGNTKSASILT